MTSYKSIDQFFKDKDGNWAIAQFPNVLLSIWIVLAIVQLFLHNTGLNDHIKLLRDAILFAWSYLELTEGSSNFRKTLGGFVMVVTVAGFFVG